MDYKTFAELADYAKQQARKSADQGDYQAFGYWVGIMEWASLCDMNRDNPARYLQNAVDARQFWLDRVAQGDTRDLSWVAMEHARAALLHRMLVNRGERLPDLSVSWLRDAAAQL